MKPFVRTGIIGSIVMIAIMFMTALYFANTLPEQGPYPVHFNANGVADRFGSKQEALFAIFVLPVVASLTTLILAAVPYLDPRQQNLTRSWKAYLTIWLGLMALFTFLTAGIGNTIASGASNLSGNKEMVRWIIAASSLFIVVVGNFLPKTRSSFTLGIRTPWTLSSDLAWEKTHRLGGPLFMAAGALGFVGAFVFDGLFLALQLSVLVVSAALISVIYSYFAWRNADDKDPGSSLTI